MSVENIEVFLFDMGNTVFDFHVGKKDEEKDMIGLERLSNYLRDKYNTHYNMHEMRTVFLDKLHTYLDDERKQFGIETDIGKFFKNLVAEELKNEDILCMSKIFYSQYIEDVKIEDDALEVFEKIKKKNKKIGIVSNCFLPDDIYIQIFRDKGLDRFVDRYFFSYSNRIMKPSHKLFSKAINYFNTKPDRYIMIGDNLNADINPAGELGMKTCLFDKKLKYVDYTGQRINCLKTILEWI